MAQPAVIYNKGIAITKSDTVNIVGPKPLTDAIFVGATGVMIVVWQDDTTSAFTCAVGEIVPVAAKRVNSGSTTADLMVALYQV